MNVKVGRTLVLCLLMALMVAVPAHAATASWSFEPSKWDFGTRLPGAGPSPAKAFTLTNTGEVELSVVFVSLGGSSGSGFAIAENTCGALSPGESCKIDLTFDPTSAGPKGG